MKQEAKHNIRSFSGSHLFQLRHLLVLFFILVGFQFIVTAIHKTSLQKLLERTQNWYQKDSAEKIANLTATSLEMLIETKMPESLQSEEYKVKIIQAFNIILTQQILQNNVEELCLIAQRGKEIYAIDNGLDLYNFLNKSLPFSKTQNALHKNAITKYYLLKDKIRKSEETITYREGENTFHVFIPFVPRGEFRGALYMRHQPDFSFITDEMISSYNEITLIFFALILFGLLTMFFISSYTIRERDKAGKLLMEERARFVAEKIAHEKETLFTKRIYHTHHKAEKVMGFIKEDLRSLNGDNINAIKSKILKYANFVSRAIYDMKWYDPPLQTMRNPIFQTDINQVILFLVENIFNRTSTKLHNHSLELNLDKHLPVVNINEFVVWEIIEPIIQNSFEHAGSNDAVTTISTVYYPDSKKGLISVSDNGVGIKEDLLKPSENGIKRIFMENISTKTSHPNSGYGCYLAYEITRRSNWAIDAQNLPDGGCVFSITITY